MTLGRLRKIGNDADYLRKLLAKKSGSYAIDEDEAEMVRELIRFVLSFDDMDVQLTSEDGYSDGLMFGA